MFVGGVSQSVKQS